MVTSTTCFSVYVGMSLLFKKSDVYDFSYSEFSAELKLSLGELLIGRQLTTELLSAAQYKPQLYRNVQRHLKGRQVKLKYFDFEACHLLSHIFQCYIHNIHASVTLHTYPTCCGKLWTTHKENQRLFSLQQHFTGSTGMASYPNRQSLVEQGRLPLMVHPTTLTV